MQRNLKEASGINRRFENEKGVATFLGKSPRYVRNLANQKLIPYIALPGRDRIYDREKVIEALSRFEVKAVGQ